MKSCASWIPCNSRRNTRWRRRSTEKRGTTSSSYPPFRTKKPSRSIQRAGDPPGPICGSSHNPSNRTRELLLASATPGEGADTIPAHQFLPQHSNARIAAVEESPFVTHPDSNLLRCNVSVRSGQRPTFCGREHSHGRRNYCEE